jgi:hypothetical protein
MISAGYQPGKPFEKASAPMTGTRSQSNTTKKRDAGKRSA